MTITTENLVVVLIAMFVGGVCGIIIANLITARLNERMWERREKQLKERGRG